MEKTIPSPDVEVKSSDLAVECGTLAVLLDAIEHQPVLVMPLARTCPRGSLTISQWIIHVTTRSTMHSPISYATLRAAEVVHTATATTLTFPYQQGGSGVMHRAEQLQEQVLTCVLDLLAHDPRVSRVIIPARMRLPDTWVWSARCEEARIQYRNNAWTLVDA